MASTPLPGSEIRLTGQEKAFLGWMAKVGFLGAKNKITEVGFSMWDFVRLGTPRGSLSLLQFLPQAFSFARAFPSFSCGFRVFSSSRKDVSRDILSV